MKYTVETKNKKGEWKFQGMYSEKYIPQLVNACINQAKKGKQMYHKLRVKMEDDNGETFVL